MNTKKTIRAGLVAAMALGVLTGTACTTPPTGGGGASLQPGCFETIWGPDQGRFEIIQNSLGTYFLRSYAPGDPTCSGSPAGSDTQIFPGSPNSNSDVICQSQHGPDATASEALCHQIVPRQVFCSCNYPI